MAKGSSALLFLAAALALSFSVVSGQGSSCIGSFSSSEDYFPFGYNDSDPFAIPLGQAVVDTSKVFSVQYNKSYKTVYSNFTKATYVLYQCGAPVPTSVNSSIAPIQIPIALAAIDSTIIIPYFELLGLYPYLKAVDAKGAAYANSPCFQKLLESNATKSYNLTEGFNGTIFTGGMTLSTSRVQFDASFDPGPLKRTEWIKYLAVFFNKEAEATALFDKISANYECLNGSNKVDKQPVVTWVSIGLHGKNIVYVENEAYKLQLVSDAGGLSLEPSVYGKYNLSVPADLATLKSILQRVDIIVDESYAPFPAQYNITTFRASLRNAFNSSYSFITNKNVWRVDRRANAIGGLDWYEGFLAQPQIALQEMLAIVNPAKQRTPYFFRNIAAGDEVVILTSKSCSQDPNVPLSPTIFTCASVPVSGAPVPVSGAPVPVSGASMAHAPLLLLFAISTVFALFL